LASRLFGACQMSLRSWALMKPLTATRARTDKSGPAIARSRLNPVAEPMRLTIVQYAGDYREAWARFERGGKATYQAQRYSVDFVGSLAARLDQVAVICGVTDEAYNVVLSNGVRAVGAGLDPGFNPKQLIELVVRTAPDRLILVTPLAPILKWARSGKVRTLATLADSFETSGLRDAIRHRRLAYHL